MFFFSRPDIKPIHRNFTPAYLIDSENQSFYETNGYTIIKNVLSNKEIIDIRLFFEKIQKQPSYNVKDKFESAGNFECKETQKLIFDFIKEFMENISYRFCNLSNCDIGDGGTFFIKPIGKESILHPHQDSAVIDETKSYGIFVWIPLDNITTENGPLYVLPKSHLWGNVYRSQHISWSFRKHYKYLWEKMIPLLVNKGDIICFDTSIIHASTENHSQQERVALAGALLPKNHKKIEYTKSGNKIYEYLIDNEYWLDGGKTESLKNYDSIIHDYVFPNPISKNQILNLLKN